MNALSSLEIELHAPAGDRIVSAQELPLSIGGQGATIVAPGAQRPGALAEVGADEHGLFVEPTESAAGAEAGSARLSLNARPLHERTRLAHGDVLGVADGLVFFLLAGHRPRLHVEHARQEDVVPPAPEENTLQELVQEADTQAIPRAAFRPLVRAEIGAPRGQRRWRWAVAAALGLLAAVLWLLMTATPLQVRTEPGDADIDLDGGLALGFGGHYLLRPGAYVLTVAREGYATVTREIEVTEAPNQQVNVTLARLPGLVRFDTGTVMGTVHVDGAPLGQVPGEYRVAAGAHTFTIIAPRHLEWSERVQVQGGGERQTITVQLTPAFSPMTIESKPAGARVTIDDRDLGVTPLTTELDAGTHALTLSATGFRRWEGAIQVQPNAAQTVGPIELGLPDGKLVVQTRPAGAEVTVSGRYRGRSPLEVNLAPGVQYAVEISRAGYEPERRTIGIEAGRRATLNLDLSAILGEVTIRGEPADARLAIEGEPKGAANQTLKLPSTQLKVEITREGYLPYTTTVTPQPGVARVVEYRLLTPAQAKAARIPPVITTQVGGRLRLMPTGTYPMGSSRREAGSRTNESRRTVTLQRPFYLGVKEVTNAEYRRFQPDHLSGIVKNRSLDQDNHPVVNVSWRDAVEFCNWLSIQEGLPQAYEQQGDTFVLTSPATTGYRLPTEAEWEWGARRQPGRAELRTYQWGQALPVPRNAGNYADKASLLVLESGLQGYEDGFVTTAPAGSFAPNALGLYDMDGNVSEWVHDYYTVYRELDPGSATDPTGLASGERRTVRGAHWRTTDLTDLRLAWRDSFEGSAQHIGFRIARYAE